MSVRPLMSLTLLIALSTVALSACGTIAGAGRDVSSAGRVITTTANDAAP